MLICRYLHCVVNIDTFYPARGIRDNEAKLSSSPPSATSLPGSDSSTMESSAMWQAPRSCPAAPAHGTMAKLMTQKDLGPILSFHLSPLENYLFNIMKIWRQILSQKLRLRILITTSSLYGINFSHITVTIKLWTKYLRKK